jgi:hypothetical protein
MIEMFQIHNTGDITILTELSDGFGKYLLTGRRTTLGR